MMPSGPGSRSTGPVLSVGQRVFVHCPGDPSRRVAVTDDADAVALADDAVGGLPHGVSVRGLDARALGLVPGMRVVVSASDWSIPDAGVRVVLHGAQRWSPGLSSVGPHDWPARRRHVTAHLHRIGEGSTPLSAMVRAAAQTAMAELSAGTSLEERVKAALRTLLRD